MADANDSLLSQLIQTQRTLVLATADPEPWSAPVYFLYWNQRFYFFSSAQSRHVIAALAANRCAGSIFRDSDDWRQIEGLQMEGRLVRVPVGTEAFGAFDKYLRKFPTVKELFAQVTLNLKQFSKRFHTQLYAFVPERASYVNNQAGLGDRQEIQLPFGSRFSRF